MFTGLVETIGTLSRRSGNMGGARAFIETDLGELVLGESVSVQGAVSTYDWTFSTTDPRALQKAAPLGSTDRFASCWYSSSSFTIDVNLTDGKAHQVSLYAVDWDSTARSEKIEVLDAVTGKVLDTRQISSFNGGVYLTWQVTGNVKFRITRLAGANAVVNGLFID